MSAKTFLEGEREKGGREKGGGGERRGGGGGGGGVGLVHKFNTYFSACTQHHALICSPLVLI